MTVIGTTFMATVAGWRRADTIQSLDEIGTVLGIGRVQRVEKSRCPIFKVMFGDGTELYVTAEHQFYTRAKRPSPNKTWDPKDYTYFSACLKDMRVGNDVRAASAPMPRNSTPNKPDQLSDATYGFLVGLALSRGSFVLHDRTNPFFVIRLGTKPSVEWVKRLKLVLQEAGALGIDTVLGNEIMYVSGRPVRYCHQYLCAAGNVPEIVRQFTEKRVPLEYQNSNRECLSGLLDGLFSCDAKLSTGERQFGLRLRVDSIEMGRDIRRILLMFGIHGLVTKPFRLTKMTGYDVRLNGENLKPFYKDIGLTYPEKAKALRSTVMHCALSHESWLTVITSIEPAGNAEVYSIYESDTGTYLTEGIVAGGGDG